MQKYNDCICLVYVNGRHNAGQLVIASLLERGEHRICVAIRDVTKAKTLFGEENMEKMQVCDLTRLKFFLCFLFLFYKHELMVNLHMIQKHCIFGR